MMMKTETVLVSLKRKRKRVFQDLLDFQYELVYCHLDGKAHQTLIDVTIELLQELDDAILKTEEALQLEKVNAGLGLTVGE